MMISDTLTRKGRKESGGILRQHPDVCYFASLFAGTCLVIYNFILHVSTCILCLTSGTSWDSSRTGHFCLLPTSFATSEHRSPHVLVYRPFDDVPPTVCIIGYILSPSFCFPMRYLVRGLSRSCPEFSSPCPSLALRSQSGDLFPPSDGDVANEPGLLA